MTAIVPLGHLNDMLRAEMPDFDFTNPSEDPIELTQVLIKTMKQGNGMGLAANQIGKQVRVFTMMTDPPMVCFNPRVTWTSDEQIVLDEGCLSYPGVAVKVKRPKDIRAKFQDPYGNVVVKKFTGLAARVFLHEMDHLDGVEYFNRANPMHKERFKRKWEKTVRTIKNYAASKDK